MGSKLLPDLLGSTHVHGLSVDLADPRRLLIATHHGVYATSGDGMAHAVSQRQDDFMGFSPHPTDAAVLYASGHPATGGNMGIVGSVDGGRTWRNLAPGVGGPVDFHQLDVSKADPRVLYGVYGQLQVSRDGGNTWRAVGPRLDDVIDLAASALAADTVYVGTQCGVRISRDAGETWLPAHPGDAPATMVATSRGGTVYAFVIDAGLFKAGERDLRWEPLFNDFGRRVLLHLAVDATDEKRLFASTQHGELFRSLDGGRSWDIFAMPARSGGTHR